MTRFRAFIVTASLGLAYCLQIAASPRAGATEAPGAAGACAAFPGAYQLSGADGVTPAAWSGDGLVVPACGPIPDAGGPRTAVYPYPGALWTPGYQCVELSERYLYERYGVTMGVSTNGDQVVAHYAAAYPALFTVVPNGTPGHAPAAGDVLSLSNSPGFDSAEGGHTAVVQSSDVSAAGDGTVTIVEENATAAGVEVLPVTDWTLAYGTFRYAEWLTPVQVVITPPHLPTAHVGEPYTATLSATGGTQPYRWELTSGELPAGLALAPDGTISGTVIARPSARRALYGEPGPLVTVTATDAHGASAIAFLSLVVAVSK